MISFFSGKTIHTFTSTGTFSAPSPLNQTPLSVEYVVVAGGGAGASQGGGGGAGGLLTSTTTVPSGSYYTVTVGAGAAGPGTGEPARNVVASNGNP